MSYIVRDECAVQALGEAPANKIQRTHCLIITALTLWFVSRDRWPPKKGPRPGSKVRGRRANSLAVGSSNVKHKTLFFSVFFSFFSFFPLRFVSSRSTYKVTTTLDGGEKEWQRARKKRNP